MTLVLVIAVIGAAGCARVAGAPPKPAHDWSGFLGDYSRLHLGDPGDLAYVYRNPDARWTGYDKVLVEPVALWRSGTNAFAAIPRDDLLRVVSRFEAAGRACLGAGFRLVTTAEPGTLRLRLAITEAHAADPVVDKLSATPAELAHVTPATGPLGPALAAFMEAASIEGELRDAVSGELLAQGIDRRRAGAPPRIPTWEALDRALGFWADQTCARLEARTRPHPAAKTSTP